LRLILRVKNSLEHPYHILPHIFSLSVNHPDNAPVPRNKLRVFSFDSLMDATLDVRCQGDSKNRRLNLKKSNWESLWWILVIQYVLFVTIASSLGIVGFIFYQVEDRQVKNRKTLLR